MRIQELKIHGFKGLEMTMADLGSMVTITGRNRSGKTTIFDAIQTVTCGRLPALSPEENTKTAGIMRKLGPVDGYEIEAIADSGSASYKVSKALITHKSDLPRVSMADASAFFKATGPARIKAVIEAADLVPYQSEFEAIEDKIKALQIDYERAGDSLVDQADHALKSITGRQAAIREMVKILGDQFEPDCDRPSEAVILADEKQLNDVKNSLHDMQAAARLWSKKEQLAEPPTLEVIDNLASSLNRLEARRRALIGQDDITAGKMRMAQADLDSIVIPAVNLDDACRHCGAAREHWTKVELSKEMQEKQAADQEARKAAISLVIAELNSEIQMNRPERASLDSEIEALKAEQARANLQRKQHADMIEVMRPTFSESDHAEVVEMIDYFSGRIEAAKADLKAWQVFEDWQAQANKYKAETKALAPVAKKLREWAKSLSERVFSSVLATGNAITKEVFGFQFEFFSRDLIYWRDGVAISFASMSGSERAMATLTVNLGLQLAGGAKIALIDEFSAFSPSHGRALKGALKKAIKAGDLDQAWIITPDDSDLKIS